MLTIIRLRHRPVASADEMDEAMGEAAGVDGCEDAPGHPGARSAGRLRELTGVW